MVMTLGCMRAPTKSTVIQPLGHWFTGLDFVSISPRRKGGQTIECCQVSNDPHGGVVGLYPSYAWDENINSPPKKTNFAAAMPIGTRPAFFAVLITVPDFRCRPLARELPSVPAGIRPKNRNPFRHANKKGESISLYVCPKVRQTGWHHSEKI